MSSARSLSRLTRFDDFNPSSAAWAEEDLARRLYLALNIAKRAIEFLGDDGYWDEAAPEDSFARDKPLAETAMLLHVAIAVTTHAEIKERVEELSILLASRARSPRTACAIALHPTICLQLAMPHILLSRRGLKDSNFDRILGLSAASLAHRGREAPPHRALERMWLQSLRSNTPPGAEFDAAALESVLNQSIDLLWGARDDAYAYTHTLMYFLGFGYAPRPLPRMRSAILGECAGLLARSLMFEDYDLAGELLMAWPLTSAPWGPAATFGFRVLADLEDKVGFLPAANGFPEKVDRLTGSDRTKYALAASYHTAYVMGMLCALALRPRNAPPHEITGPLAPTELIEHLLSMIPNADTPWRHTFDQLRPVEQRALAPFLLDMALLARARGHDFPALGELLSIAVHHGLANTPLCAQAAELIQRVAACADGVSAGRSAGPDQPAI
jgi:hypothetical protein